MSNILTRKLDHWSRIVPRELTGSRVVEEIYAAFGHRFPGKKISLRQKDETGQKQSFAIQIAVDHDPCHDRRGYMNYETARLFDFQNGRWILALGEKGGSYPGGEYSRDIRAARATFEPDEMEADDDLLARVGSALRRSTFGGHSVFSSSVVVGMSGGDVVFPHSDLGAELRSRLGDGSVFLAEQKKYEMEIDDENVHPYRNGNQFNPLRFKREIVNYLTTGIHLMLSQYNFFSGEEVLEETYRELGKKFPHTDLVFKERVLVSLGTEERPSLMGYDRARILRGNKNIVLLNGYNRSRPFSTSACAADLTLLPMKATESTEDNIRRRLSESAPLSSSGLALMGGNDIVFPPHSKMGQKMNFLVGERLQQCRYRSWESKEKADPLLSKYYCPPYGEHVRFKQEAVPALVRGIEVLLKEE